MLLTALAVVVGAAVILFDPIFQGLAISLVAAEVASLLISRMAVPVLYSMLARRASARSVSKNPAHLGDETAAVAVAAPAGALEGGLGLEPALRVGGEDAEVGAA